MSEALVLLIIIIVCLAIASGGPKRRRSSGTTTLPVSGTGPAYSPIIKKEAQFEEFVNQFPLPEQDGRWVTSVVFCLFCGEEHTSVHPLVAELLECPYCGKMTPAPDIDED